MKRLALILCAMVGFLTLINKAEAQTGITTVIETNADSLNGSLPTIKQPQPGWSPVLDLQTSDGTSPVPQRSDPKVIATVRGGIMANANAQFQGSGGSGNLVKKAELSTI